MSRHPVSAQARVALACLDLTSLGDGDTAVTIQALGRRASQAPAAPAALCVWPRFVAQARAAAPQGVRIAAVANFPDGSLDRERALTDVRQALGLGADEIDLVLPWRALAEGDLAGPAQLVRAVRQVTFGRTLKLILETGALPSRVTLAAACRIGLDEGVDFLKTSTGKVAVGATLEAARAMLEAIARHPRGAEVGFKASGGLRTLADVAPYLDLVEDVLGAAALQPDRLRLGASSLLDDLERVLRGGAERAPTSGAAAVGPAY